MQNRCGNSRTMYMPKPRRRHTQRYSLCFTFNFICGFSLLWHSRCWCCGKWKISNMFRWAHSKLKTFPRGNISFQLIAPNAQCSCSTVFCHFLLFDWTHERRPTLFAHHCTMNVRSREVRVEFFDWYSNGDSAIPSNAFTHSIYIYALRKKTNSQWISSTTTDSKLYPNARKLQRNIAIGCSFESPKKKKMNKKMQ